MFGKYRYLVIVLACLSIIMVYFFNPVDHIWMPKCPTKMIFGIDCPGCGLQRAAYALMHGHLIEAIRYNLFFVVAFPYLFLILIGEFMREGNLQQKIRKITQSKWMTNGYIFIFFFWFVIRNILDI